MKRNWHDFLEFLLGAWIIVSPFALGFISLGNPAGTAILIGALVIGFMVVGVSMPSYWEEWVSFVLGTALLVSPWVFGYGEAVIATTNAVICGALLMGLAVIGLIRERSFHQRPHAGMHG